MPMNDVPHPKVGEGMTIALLTHKSFDSNNIKVVIDILSTIMEENYRKHPNFLVISKDDRVNYQIKKFLMIYSVPEEKIKFIDHDDRDIRSLNNSSKDDQCCCAFHEPTSIEEKDTLYRGLEDTYLSTCLNHLGGCCNLRLIYIFTNNTQVPFVTNITEMAKRRRITCITINSDWDYINHMDESDPRNHMEIYGGIYKNANAKESKEAPNWGVSERDQYYFPRYHQSK